MDMIILSQTALPVVNNSWGFFALLAVLLLQAYQFKLSHEREERAAKREEEAKKSAIVTQNAIGVVAENTEKVHLALNSQLDAFKREAAEQYKLAVSQEVAKVRLEMEAKITALEIKLDNAKEKAVTLAASNVKDQEPIPVTLSSPNPLPVIMQNPVVPPGPQGFINPSNPYTAEERLAIIRGEKRIHEEK